MSEYETGYDPQAWAYAIPCKKGEEYDHWVFPNWEDAEQVRAERDAHLEEDEPDEEIIPLYPKVRTPPDGG